MKKIKIDGVYLTHPLIFNTGGVLIFYVVCKNKIIEKKGVTSTRSNS